MAAAKRPPPSRLRLRHLGPVSVRIERWSTQRESDALDFLGREPYDNVFLTYLAANDTNGTLLRAMRVAVDASQRVRGVAYFGHQVVLAAGDEAIAHFARANAGGNERMIVGPRPQVMRYWELVAASHAPPRKVRDRQFVMALQPEDLSGEDSRVTVRQARADDCTAVAVNSAAMIRHELEYDPVQRDPGFIAGIAQMIARRLWWVGESGGVLCFFCNVGPWSTRTAQLQGIWTPPAMRGRGLATAALSGVCKVLLASVPTLSLYVNDFNGGAVRLYERTGFRTVSEFQTLLF